MLKKSARPVLPTLLALLCCLAASPARAAGLEVAAGIAPVKHFVERIGGARVSVALMVPAGADAHAYEPKPSQMRAVSRARAYFAVGLEFERAWTRRYLAANPGLVIVDTDQGIAKQPLPGHHHAAAAHRHDEGPDVHVWVAPRLARRMAERILEALSALDPAHAAEFAANHRAFMREIEALDAELAALFADVPAKRRVFMVFHPAWGYFAAAYGLTQVPVEAGGREPGPRALARIIDQAREHGVLVVFVQPQVSDRVARSIARAVGGQVVAADPLAEDWAANLRRVGQAFRAAMR